MLFSLNESIWEHKDEYSHPGDLIESLISSENFLIISFVNFARRDSRNLTINAGIKVKMRSIINCLKILSKIPVNIY
jgi:hypothetical protein